MKNKDIAKLMDEQTYAERMEMAKFISDAALELARDHGADSLDADYFAELLESWVDSELEDHP